MAGGEYQDFKDQDTLTPPIPPLKASEQALLKALKARDNAFKRWNAKIDGLRNALKDCSHSVTTEYHWEHDNGYGRQSKHIGLRCTLCLKKNHWPGVGRNNWVEDNYDRSDD